MSNKVKPWQQRKPKHHGNFSGKKPHVRPGRDKVILPRERNESQDRYGQRDQYGRNDYPDE